MRIPTIAAAAVLALAACASKTSFNQSFLTSEELKLSANSAYISFKTTGESIDLAGIRKQETGAKNVVLIKTHGVYYITGDGFRNVWKLWPVCGRDKAAYKALKLKPPTAEFVKPSLEKSGDCALLKWTEMAGERKAFINRAGDMSPDKCPEE